MTTTVVDLVVLHEHPEWQKPLFGGADATRCPVRALRPHARRVPQRRDAARPALFHPGEPQRVPIVFDFESPRGSSLIETVTTLAGISKMVIANLNGKSVPAELERITSSYQKPLIACVRADREKAVYALFSDLLEKNNVHYLKYRTTDQLLEKLPKKIHEAESSFHRLQIQRHERVLRKLKEG
jgi:hypothetical protein